MVECIKGGDVMKEWFIQLISSHNFWSSLITALVGGAIAYFIAKIQVKKSEKEITTQRIEDNTRHVQELEEAQKRVLLQINEMKKHEREMELLRIQLGYCNESMASVVSISELLAPLIEKVFDYNDARNSSINGEITDEIIELKKGMLTVTNPIRDKSIRISTAVRINSLSEEDSKVVDALLKSIRKIIVHTYQNEFEEFITLTHLIANQIEEVYPIFLALQEELIASLNNNQS